MYFLVAGIIALAGVVAYLFLYSSRKDKQHAQELRALHEKHRKEKQKLADDYIGFLKRAAESSRETPET